MDMNVNTSVTINVGRCAVCPGEMKFLFCDREAVYFRCEACGYKDRYVFKDEEEAELYLEKAKREMLARITNGCQKWEYTQWKQLRRDLLRFRNQYIPLDLDIEVQIAEIACMTLGYNIMDDDIYDECKLCFEVMDQLYKYEKKMMKKHGMNPNLSSTMQGYQAAREQYIKCRNTYLEKKLIWKVILWIWNFLKKLIFRV
jgi:hypothetical protein